MESNYAEERCIINDSAWRLLYKIGGAAALISVAIVPISWSSSRDILTARTVTSCKFSYSENTAPGLARFRGPVHPGHNSQCPHAARSLFLAQEKQ
jgi:hypothetical protein